MLFPTLTLCAFGESYEIMPLFLRALHPISRIAPAPRGPTAHRLVPRDPVPRLQGPCKRLYVIGSHAARQSALDEAEDVVRFKLTGESSNRFKPGGGGPRDDRGGNGDFRDYRDERGPPPRAGAPRP